VRLEDDSVAHFIVTDIPEELSLGSYVRIDGLFVKLLRREGHEGEWNEGPLLIGSRAVKSYARNGTYDETVLAARLKKIEDDVADKSTGLDDAVYRAQWLLMDFAKTEEYAAINWDETPELDNLTMVDILKNGGAWRGKPIRIPVSRNMGIWTLDAGENPSRIDQITTGWIGNMSWVNQAGLIKFIMPEYRPDLTDRKNTANLIEGRGFFVKNHNYEPRDGGVRNAPYFVLTSLEIFTPTEDHLATYLMYGVFGLAVFLMVFFPVLLFRDRKKSRALQETLTRRKQERRRRMASEQPQA